MFKCFLRFCFNCVTTHGFVTNLFQSVIASIFLNVHINSYMIRYLSHSKIAPN
jgi:hypothetical protein